VLFLENHQDKKLFQMPFLNSSFNLFDKVFYFGTGKGSLPSLEPLLARHIKSHSSRNSKENKENKVVFFGAAHHKTNEEHFAFTNKCLRYIESNFPKGKYYYKPHPHDKVEQKSINLGNFSKLLSNQTTENILLEREKYTHFFSVASTSIVNCINLGKSNSYLFVDMYPYYSSKFKDFLETQYKPIRKYKKAFIKSFEKQPQEYEIRVSGFEKNKYNKYIELLS
jgi:hypothetical protein